MYADDKLHEECGIFGIYAPGRDVARHTFFALYALQHRGQEGAGIVTCDGRTAHIHKGMGLVSQVFNEENLSHLKGDWAIGSEAKGERASRITASPAVGRRSGSFAGRPGSIAGRGE